MPKMIGNTIHGARQIEDNARSLPERARLSYAQAVMLPPERVMCSLNTSDNGGFGRFAKRWYNWFAKPEDILALPNATESMIRSACQCLPGKDRRSNCGAGQYSVHQVGETRVYLSAHWIYVHRNGSVRKLRRRLETVLSWHKSPVLPRHIQRRLYEMALNGSRAIRIQTDRSRYHFQLVETSTGETYHILYWNWKPKPSGDAIGGARQGVRAAIRAFRLRRYGTTETAHLERADIAAQQTRTFVDIDRSVASGNCRPMTEAFARQMWERIGASGPAAVRADIILAERNDAYTRRAVAYAAQQRPLDAVTL